MRELLCSRGAIPSLSPPASFSSSGRAVGRTVVGMPSSSTSSSSSCAPISLHESRLSRAVRAAASSHHWNGSGGASTRRHGNSRKQLETTGGCGNLLKCGRWIYYDCDCLRLRDRVGIRVPLFSEVCRKPAKEKFAVASSLRCRTLVCCDGCGSCKDGLRILSSYPPSSPLLSSIGQQQEAKVSLTGFSDTVVPFKRPTVGTCRVAKATPRCCSQSHHVHSAMDNNFQSEYRLGPDNRPLIIRSFSGRADIVRKRVKLMDMYSSHVEAREVTVHSKPRPWWKQILFQQLSEEDFGDDPEDDYGSDEESSSSSLEDERILQESDLRATEDPTDEDEIDDLISDDRRYFSWQQKKNALDELREYQESGRDPDSRDWEDWLDDSWGDYSQYLNKKDSGWSSKVSEWEKGGVPRQPPKMPERGMNRTIKELLLRIFEPEEEVEDDLTFEEKVFRFTSRSTAKFVMILILVPWGIDFLVHDFVVVPFLKRWVEEVPLAARILDLKESQKLYMVDRLKLERQRVRFEAEIGKAPALSDRELNEHIREEALELREQLREENRNTFANIWSDAVAGFTIFLLLIFNPQQVAIMQMTGDRLFTNVSDTGKAFIIILGTDIFLGYHSESGWETVIEILLDHYGLEASLGSIYLFVAIVPVTIDACFKLWVFRYLSKLSPSAAATFREMKRH